MKWWLSYASEEGFLGVVVAEIDDSWIGKEFTAGPHTVIDDTGFLHACRVAVRRGCSPGGEVRGYRVPWDAVDGIAKMEPFRLYSKEELVELDVGVSTLGDNA